MAFVWSEDVSVGASIDAADVNEVQDNLDAIYTDLGITKNGCASGAGWSELPVSAGDSITNAQFQEMRDVTDYAHDNKCPSDNATYQSTEYTTEDTTVDSTHDAGVDATHDAGVDSGYDSGVHTTQDVGYDATHDAGVDAGYDSGVHSPADSGYGGCPSNYNWYCVTNYGAFVGTDT